MVLVLQQSSEIAAAFPDSFLTYYRPFGQTACELFGTSCKQCMLMLELAAAGLE